MAIAPLVDELAAAVAAAIGGEVVLLDGGEFGAYGIALGRRHRVLVRNHARTANVCVPPVESVEVASANEIPAAIELVRRGLDRLAGEEPFTLADAAVRLRALGLTAEAGWTLSFPGVPVPSEAWLQGPGAGAVGMFVGDGDVRLVVWEGATRHESYVDAEDEHDPSLAAWLHDRLGAQARAAVERAAADVEVQRARDALTLADLEALLARGGTVREGGGRWWRKLHLVDGALHHEEFDEGDLTTGPARPGALQAVLDRRAFDLVEPPGS